MPYCAIWSGFCFATLTDEEGEALTRITNGIIERFWSYKKKSQSYLAQTPINYTNSSLDKTRVQARIFIKSMKGEEVYSDSDIEDELNEHNHKEGWSKKRKIIKVKSRKPPLTGHYQKSTQVFKKTKFAVPTMPPPDMPLSTMPPPDMPPPDIIDDTMSCTESYATSSYAAYK